MENDDTNADQGKTPSDLPPLGTQKQTRKERSKANEASEEPNKQQKHSLWRNWKSLSRTRQVELSLAAIGAVGYLIAYICVSISQKAQSAQQFSMQHRPRVIFSRPPELFGDFSCSISDTRLESHAGNMRIWLKNIKSGDAVGVFPAVMDGRLIPDKPTGIKFYDERTKVTEATCTMRTNPKMQPFALNSGQEMPVELAQSAGAMSMPGTFLKPPKPLIDKDDTLQWYLPICAFYFDEEGNSHGTCQTFRFKTKAGYSLLCNKPPVGGEFEAVFFGYCEN